MSYERYLSFLSQAELKAAPKELFHEGNFDLLMKSPKVAVVGSREVSNDGIRRTQMIATELVNRGVTVVSGLAQGVDTIAHTTALSGKTIAVLGTPISMASPVSNTELLNEIKKNHLAITQFKEGSKVYPSNFPARNKTMALITDATIIIEASERSGTQHQAWEAIRLGRQVFLMENIIKSDIKWAHKALEYGAVVLTKDNYGYILDSIAEFHLEITL
ncbi:DNA processing protein [Lacibacter cauensis]|uniref:DNA processing protein n=1 Tax=Lacibacter cauensis TaxID=510947 RepID=A0A562SQK6_9BACT|nr:DNA-processing protein DprA [Lacibacter cauensis]TWI83294.1 DNA processing protein [Lacibacter cauensis]